MHDPTTDPSSATSQFKITRRPRKNQSTLTPLAQSLCIASSSPSSNHPSSSKRKYRTRRQLAVLSETTGEENENNLSSTEDRNRNQMFMEDTVVRKRNKKNITQPPSSPPTPPPVSVLRMDGKNQIVSTPDLCSSPPLLLPTLRSRKHPDLNVIHPTTVQQIIENQKTPRHGGSPHRYIFVDCRFAYEHQGGSLREAVSISNPHDMIEAFLTHPRVNTVLIFFCEFSIHRAPKMVRYLRNLDRQVHAETYPSLYYPQLYLIDGGYQRCFETIQESCSPVAYVTMRDATHVDACKAAFQSLRKRWKEQNTSETVERLMRDHKRKS